MKAFALAGIALLLAPMAGVPGAAAQSSWQGYQLGAEDQIEVQIHGQGFSPRRAIDHALVGGQPDGDDDVSIQIDQIARAHRCDVFSGHGQSQTMGGAHDSAPTRS